MRRRREGGRERERERDNDRDRQRILYREDMQWHTYIYPRELVSCPHLPLFDCL